jgi:hypothetical protein
MQIVGIIYLDSVLIFLLDERRKITSLFNFLNEGVTDLAYKYLICVLY